MDIRQEFGHLLRIIIPQDVSLTILKGTLPPGRPPFPPLALPSPRSPPCPIVLHLSCCPVSCHVVFYPVPLSYSLSCTPSRHAPPFPVVLYPIVLHPVLHPLLSPALIPSPTSPRRRPVPRPVVLSPALTPSPPSARHRPVLRPVVLSPASPPPLLCLPGAVLYPVLLSCHPPHPRRCCVHQAPSCTPSCCLSPASPPPLLCPPGAVLYPVLLSCPPPHPRRCCVHQAPSCTPSCCPVPRLTPAAAVSTRRRPVPRPVVLYPASPPPLLCPPGAVLYPVLLSCPPPSPPPLRPPGAVLYSVLLSCPPPHPRRCCVRQAPSCTPSCCPVPRLTPAAAVSARRRGVPRPVVLSPASPPRCCVRQAPSCTPSCCPVPRPHLLPSVRQAPSCTPSCCPVPRLTPAAAVSARRRPVPRPVVLSPASPPPLLCPPGAVLYPVLLSCPLPHPRRCCVHQAPSCTPSCCSVPRLTPAAAVSARRRPVPRPVVLSPASPPPLLCPPGAVLYPVLLSCPPPSPPLRPPGAVLFPVLLSCLTPAAAVSTRRRPVRPRPDRRDGAPLTPHLRRRRPQPLRRRSSPGGEARPQGRHRLVHGRLRPLRAHRPVAGGRRLGAAQLHAGEGGPAGERHQRVQLGAARCALRHRARRPPDRHADPRPERRAVRERHQQQAARDSDAHDVRRDGNQSERARRGVREVCRRDNRLLQQVRGSRGG